ncbi:hypothetical protein ADL21_32030 [Streptomyces albus subsp. albus]|nr:hypothetical protein ADL21_32030 [Streptomyces albus subsp. albus]
MALTQHLARVSEAYVAQCRRNAAASADGDPEWNPPDEDVLDLDWAVWGLLRYCQEADVAGEWTGVLRRSIKGGNADSVRFLDHPEVYDGFGAPPALLAPPVVAEVARRLDVIDMDSLLRDLPADADSAAAICGFGTFHGHLRKYLEDHVAALTHFYRGAARQGMAVVEWVD